MRRSRVVKRSPRSRAISFAGDEVTGAERRPNTPLSRTFSFAGGPSPREAGGSQMGGSAGLYPPIVNRVQSAELLIPDPPV
jgi:methyl coenzyme M reductase subunit C